MSQPQTKKQPRRRKLFMVALCLGCLLLAFVLWRVYWRVQLENEKALVHAAGFPASLEELDAWYKKPVGRNAAEAWEKANIEWDEPLEDWMPSMTCATDGTKADMYRDQEKLGLQYPDEVLEKIREFWNKNEAAWQLMQEAAEIKECRWNVDLKKGSQVDFSYLSTLRRAEKRLSERMKLAGMDKDWSGFIKMIDVGFKLANDVGNTPLIIHSVVGLSGNGMMIDTLQSEMPFFQYKSEQLAELQVKIIAQKKQVDRYFYQGFHGDEALALSDPAFSNPAAYLRNFSNDPAQSKAWWISCVVNGWIALGGLDHDRASIGCFERKLAEASLLSVDKRWAAFNLILDKNSNSIYFWNFACNEFRLNSKPFCHCSIVQMKLDAAITALAVERYHLDHNQLPEKLDALVPTYLPAIPEDIFNHGKPLQYKIESDRFTIYSFGENEKDDAAIYESSWSSSAPRKDDITFTILLPNAPRGIVPKRKDLPLAP